MDTLDELEKYLENECFSFTELTIGNHYAPEGYVIEGDHGAYNFCCSERGNKRILYSFSSEKELVDYAVRVLNEDKWAKAHLVAWVYSENEIKEAEQFLEKKNILFERNDIPNFTQGITAYRIFVFGRDRLLLDKYKKKYFRR